ncbi:hypothetical protein N7517_010474 [Penicillium concentricum]|uniref:Uncharacterized protein n=1 Tax=Penicillium concentricum TaxID=293559 RepID=A0A9W9R8V9_9EURO|nr:uncharacterized protein N7517_010474 [Penicillium concentricum]KAJ5355865.1 hypothetical protein N7517_010474 [Penicillium concentricum]
MAKPSTVDAIKGLMAELKDLVKDIATLDAEMTTAGPHKQIMLYKQRMGKTSRMDSLVKQIECKIDVMDVHCKKTMTRRLRDILKVRGCGIEVSNSTKVPKHGDEESLGWKAI